MHKRGVDGFRALQSEKKGKYQTIMLQITLDMYQTLAAAVVVLALGRFLRGRVRLLERFCIPAPVIGGELFAIFTCVCYGTGIAEFAFDDILKEVCMVFFFTSVGFQANLKVLRSGGTAMIVFLVLVIGLIVGQNFVAIGLSKVLGISPLVGLCTGFYPDGRRSRHRRRVWPHAGGLWGAGSDHALHCGAHLRPDRGQHDGRPGGQDPHRKA